MSATPQSSVSPVPVPINIGHTTGAAPIVDNDTVVIDRRQGGDNLEIVWLCNAPGKIFHICFPKGSPFQQAHFSSEDNHSGKIKPDASGPYKYSIEVEGEVLDPTVIIKP
jgi:hypothetical protein